MKATDNAPRRPGKDRGGRSKKQDDPLQDILATLYSEHRYISSLLDALEQQGDRLKPGRIPDFHLLLDIADYLSHYPDQYHHPREDLLFDGMLDSDEGFQAKRERLAREHHTLHHYAMELFTELTLIAQGRPVDRPGLTESLNRFVDGYRRHMDFENRDIFPHASGTLNAADLKKLRLKTRYIDDPLFGREIHLQYRRLGRNLEARVELAGRELIARELAGIQSVIGNLSSVVDSTTQIKSAVLARHKRAWREQVATVKQHLRYNQEPGVLRLPLAVMKNHQRLLAGTLNDIRTILKDRRPGDRAPDTD
jgi:hemerythrin-like domain-containing protein